MADFRDRLRAAAGTPAGSRTTPDTLRALVQRRRRTRRAVTTALSVVVLAVAGTGVALFARSQVTRVIEFTDAPPATAAPSASEETTSASDDAASQAPPSQELPSQDAPADDEQEARAPDPEPEEEPRTQACTGPARPSDMPPGAVSTQIADVDGDGRRDIMWLDPDRNLGIITAAGSADVYAIDSAAPSAVWALAVDADERPPVELLVDDGRTAYLLVYDDCAIRPVINTADGQPWLFDRGFRGHGTGVGCVDIDGRQRLVGVNVEGTSGDTVEWSRAVVNLDGRSATAGRTDRGTFTRPDDDRAIDLLTQVTCGDLTMTEYGLSTRP